jgi:hypothetical protein
MVLKTWQYALSWIQHTLSMAFCLYFLTPDHTGLGGKRRGGWNHRTLLLCIGIVLNASIAVEILAIPKRNVFVMSLVVSPGVMILVSDAIWKCIYIHLLAKISLALILVVFLAGMRKIAARFATGGASGASLLTQAQKFFLCGVALNSVGLLVAPNSGVLAVVEIVLWTGALAEGWMHFVAFERTLNNTFRQVGSMTSIKNLNANLPQQAGSTNTPPPRRLTDTVKHANSSKKSVSRNVRFIFVLSHFAAGLALLYSPLWPANAASSGKCQV